MIITKTPFRISFAGGGSDMAAFYEKYGGCVLSTSISKYMYISIHPYFEADKTLLKYSENELVDSYDQIRHSIFRRVLTDMDIHGVGISSPAEVAGCTGLGSSSTFTVGLLNTLYCYKGKYVSKGDLAEMACQVEIEKLGNPIGKQDQYAAAFGGLNFIRFNRDGSVSVEPIMMRKETYKQLEKNLMMFFTGSTRSANTILGQQKKNISQSDKARNLLQMCDLAEQMRKSLQSDDISSFGHYLNEGWMLKKELASGISNPAIDEAYELAMKNGALGGKLLGAGGGGFLLFYCPEERQEQLKQAIGLPAFDFRFERDGTSVVYIGDKYWN
jgi:D-glycero-alpha-D-manno-heptose-7-phosphate kinase